MEREVILNHLLPYCSDKDFETANAKGMDTILFEYQTRFNYWIGLFEAQYGDILVFWNALEMTESEKLIIINGLIVDIIKGVTAKPDEGSGEVGSSEEEIN